MSRSDEEPDARSPSAARRWAAPAALLTVEFLALSVNVELPTSGTSLRLAAAVRLLIPVVIGGGAAGVLIARYAPRGGSGPLPAWPPGHRAWRTLALQLVAFGAAAALGLRLMGPGGPPVAAHQFAAWLACVAAAFALAAALVAPPLALLRHAMRHGGPPLLAVGIGILSWRAIGAAERLWTPLQGATLRAAAAILRTVSADVVADPVRSIVGAGGFEVEIAPECSGVEGLGLSFVFLAVWLSLARSRIRIGRALLVLAPVGAAAALAANAVRISLLVLLGAAGREDLALGAFHSKLGWLLFLGIAFASIAAAEHVPWLRRESGQPRDQGIPDFAAAHLAPLVAALAASLVTGLWARRGFDAWYGARAAAAAIALLLVRRTLPRPSVSPSWAPVALGVAMSALWIRWGGAGESTLAETLAALGPAERVAWVSVRVLGACIVLPVVEELAFRGFLLPWLVSPDPEALPPRAWTWPAVVLSSIAFGAIHERWLLGSVAGVAFAFARAWRGRLGDAIVAHATCNAGLAAAVLLAGRWDLWG